MLVRFEFSLKSESESFFGCFDVLLQGMSVLPLSYLSLL